MAIEDMSEEFQASWAADTDFLPACPDGCVPYPFQRAGVEYALRRRDCIIGDQMGLGKTVQALLVANEILAKRILIICPASLRINWARESAVWLLWAEPVIVGYEEAVRHADRIAGKWDLLIVDEAHRIKNPKARRTQVALAVRAERRLFLSGTPVVNRPIDLWPVLYAIDQRWGSQHQFGINYCAGRKMSMHLNTINPKTRQTTRRKRTWWDYSGASNTKALQTHLRETCMVRRLKKTVLTQLPDKIRQMIVIGESRNTTKDQLRWEGWCDLSRAPARTPEEVARLRVAKLRKLEELSKCRVDEMQEKIYPVISYLKTVTEPVVVFAHHRAMIQALQETFPHAVTVVGGMSEAAKQKSVDDFQAGATDMFIGNLEAAGVGYTLTRSSLVVFAEHDWVPGVMDQCEDRCHRIGQCDTVHVVYLVMDYSLEAYMCKVLLSKQNIIDAVLDG